MITFIVKIMKEEGPETTRTDIRKWIFHREEKLYSYTCTLLVCDTHKHTDH